MFGMCCTFAHLKTHPLTTCFIDHSLMCLTNVLAFVPHHLHVHRHPCLWLESGNHPAPLREQDCCLAIWLNALLSHKDRHTRSLICRTTSIRLRPIGSTGDLVVAVERVQTFSGIRTLHSSPAGDGRGILRVDLVYDLSLADDRWCGEVKNSDQPLECGEQVWSPGRLLLHDAAVR